MGRGRPLLILLVTLIGALAISQAEIDALHCLYETTGGPNWTLRPAWPIDGAKDPCYWTGVTCSVAGAVTGLSLESVNLVGDFPDCFYNLTNVIALNLARNALSGPVFAADFPSSLRTLNVSQNTLSGPVAWLSELEGLRSIDISLNDFTGPLPVFSDDVQYLTMHLLGNSITGGVGPICNITSLSLLDISSNALTGTIPACMGHSKNLISISLANNNLVGPLPSLPYVVILNLAANGLSGPLAPFFDSAPDLTVVALSNNQLTPPLGVMPQYLSTLDLSGNPLLGATTDQVAAWMGSTVQSDYGLSLVDLSISSAGLTGTLDPIFNQLPARHIAISHIDLSNNAITGTLPVSLLPPLLSEVVLSGNRLEGAVPETWGAALRTSLRYLDLTDNPMLYGPALPDAIVPIYTDTIANISGHYLCPKTANPVEDTALEVDPTYYGYSLCSCTDGFYGYPPTCLETTAICGLNNSVVTDCVATTAAASISFVRGYYPYPNVSHVEAMLACMWVNGQTACLSDQLNCTVDQDNQISCAGTVCNSLSQSRLCSECAPKNYLYLDNSCISCSMSLFYPMLVVVPVTIVLFLLVATAIGRATTASGTVGCGKHCSVWGKRALGVFTETSFIDVILLTLISLPQLTVNSRLIKFVPVWLYLTFFGFFALHVLLALFTERFSANLRQPWSAGIIKIALSYLQILMAMTSNVDEDNTRGGNISFLSEMSCWLPSLLGEYQQRVLFNQVLPYGFAAFVIVPTLLKIAVQYCRDMAYRGENNRKKWLQTSKTEMHVASSIILLIAYAFYFPLLIALLAYFSCAPDPFPAGSTTMYSMVHPYLECEGFIYWRTGVILMVLFSLMSIYMIFIAVRLRKLVHQGRLDDVHARAFYQLFYENYTPDRWWYDLLIIIRRTAVAVSVLIYPDSFMIYYLEVVLLTALILHEQIRPFEHRSLHYLESLSLCSALLSLQPGWPFPRLVPAIVMITYCFALVLASLYGVFPRWRNNYVMWWLFHGKTILEKEEVENNYRFDGVIEDGKRILKQVRIAPARAGGSGAAAGGRRGTGGFSSDPVAMAGNSNPDNQPLLAKYGSLGSAGFGSPQSMYTYRGDRGDIMTPP